MNMSEEEVQYQLRELNKQVRITAVHALDRTESACAMFPTDHPNGDKLIAVFARGPMALKIFEFMMDQFSKSGPTPTQKVGIA